MNPFPSAEAARWESAGWIEPHSAADHRSASAETTVVLHPEATSTATEAPLAATTDEQIEWKPSTWASSSSPDDDYHASW
jgi:hypothetical protein